MFGLQLFYRIFLIIFCQMNEPIVLFNYADHEQKLEWMIVDDGLMGGLSAGHILINSIGEVVFSGKVSLENNGGFSSIRSRFESVDVDECHIIRLHVKGDGKKYQCRIKSKWSDWYSYIQYFETTGVEQIIDIELKEMYPTFRGKRLDMNNWDQEKISEIAFLIGNKKEEEFKLIISKIEML